MKGISIRERNGKTYYRAIYQSQKVKYERTFRELNDAKKWLEEIRKIHPQEIKRLPRENEIFTDISFSGLKNQSDKNLYIAFDKQSKVYRLVTSEQIRNKRKCRNRGTIKKNKFGTYDVILGLNNRHYHIGTFKTYSEAQKKKEEIARQAALGKTIKIQTRNSTGYKNISKHYKKYCFNLNKKDYKISKYFNTLQEALDFREKYFKENGLEMPKDYIELNFN